ncbi:MAG: peptidylprolyl isomerase, partial [Roseococcus sp.]
MSRFSLPLALLLAAGPALAQAPAPSPAPAPAPAATPATTEDPNPVLARVNGQDLRLDEVMATAAEAMPAELRNVPPLMLRTML